MLMQWGQFLDHDLTFTPTTGTDCSETCSNTAQCFPILIPDDDPRIGQGADCFEFSRSAASCAETSSAAYKKRRPKQREQVDELTAYIDASNVYGSSEEDAQSLREFNPNEGLLRVSEFPGFDKGFMPIDPVDKDCLADVGDSEAFCFQAGDSRSNELLGLTAMHTIWVRAHNGIAKQLKDLNSPDYGPELIYQETRKIIGAIHQYITYEEWLPHVIGPEAMTQKLGSYNGYNPQVDASIFNAFAAAVFRFGHSKLQPFLARLDETFQEIPEGNLPLHQAFFKPSLLLETGVDPFLRGLYGIPAKANIKAQALNTEITERLFELTESVAMDLAALNLQRGRDHGLQGYNAYREACGLDKFNNFAELSVVFPDPVIDKLEALYGDVNNIDLFTGMVLEPHVEGGTVGPLFACLIAEQFRRLRDGDR